MIEIEQIKNSEDVKRAWDENRSAVIRINEAIQKANQAAIDAKAEIADLDGKVLPGLLAERFLDEKISKSKTTTAKKRKAELQENIDDLPLLLKGLEAEKRPFNSSNRHIEARERHIQIYENTKNALKQKYSPTVEEKLLEKAKFLDCYIDAQRFLKELKQGRAPGK